MAGKFFVNRGPVPREPLERFFEYVNFDESGCWLWTGSKNPRGYGQFRISRREEGFDKLYLAYRWLYERIVQTVPMGLELDHLCRTPACVNPDHLEIVTHRTNMRRGITGQASAVKQRAKTHCPQGHPYSGGNLKLTKNGWRKCRTCDVESSRQSKRRVG